MRKFLILSIIFISSCSNITTDANSDTENSIGSELEVENISSQIENNNLLVYIDRNQNLQQEDLRDKKTIIIFWADYWSICRRELPVIEKNLELYKDEYDIIALAHSESGPTLEWANENLTGALTIGFSTPELRDYFKIIGQPITIVLDQNGEIIFRDFGEFKLNNF